MAGGGAFAGGGILAQAGSCGVGSRHGVGAVVGMSAGQHPSVAVAAGLMSSHLQAGQYHKVLRLSQRLFCGGFDRHMSACQHVVPHLMSSSTALLLALPPRLVRRRCGYHQMKLP